MKFSLPFGLPWRLDQWIDCGGDYWRGQGREEHSHDSGDNNTENTAGTARHQVMDQFVTLIILHHDNDGKNSKHFYTNIITFKFNNNFVAEVCQ